MAHLQNVLQGRTKRAVYENQIGEEINHTKDLLPVFISNCTDCQFSFQTSTIIQLTISNCKNCRLIISSKILTDAQVIGCSSLSIISENDGCCWVFDNTTNSNYRQSDGEFTMYSTKSQFDIFYGLEKTLQINQQDDPIRLKISIDGNGEISQFPCNNFGDII